MIKDCFRQQTIKFKALLEEDAIVFEEYQGASKAETEKEWVEVTVDEFKNGNEVPRL